MAELAQRRSVGLSNPGAWIGHVLDGEKLFGYVLVAPAIIYIILLVGYPFAIALWFSVSNSIGVHAGLFTQGPNWLGEEYPAMISIILVNVWRNLPFSAVVLTAGIGAVPQEILEAANLDGANWWVRWRKVIVPIIAPILYIALLFSLVFTFTDMTVVWLMTIVNPVGETHVIASYAFQTGIVAGSIGRGATMSLVLFPVLLVGALLLLRNLKARTID